MLSKLFSSKKRIKVLEYVLYKETVRVTEVSTILNLSKGFISEFLSILFKNKILYKKDGYHPIDSSLTRAIKILININKIKLSKIKRPFIKGIGLFGSWANGTNIDNSDLDIYIKTDKYPDEKELAILSKKLREMADSEIQLLVLTPNKIRQIKKDKPFYSNLIYNSIVLWGEPID